MSEVFEREHIGFEVKEEEFGTTIPLDEIARRVRKRLEGFGYEVSIINIRQEGAYITCVPPGTDAWALVFTDWLRGAEQGVRIPTREEIEKT